MHIILNIYHSTQTFFNLKFWNNNEKHDFEIQVYLNVLKFR